MNEPEDVTTALNRELTLNCSAKGWPPVASKWIRLHKDSELLFQTKTVSVESYSFTLGMFHHAKRPFLNWFPESTPLKDYETGQVRFDFTREEAGHYKCIATNAVGSIEKLIYLAYFGKLTYPTVVGFEIWKVGAR